MPLVHRIARDALPLYASALTVTAGAVVQTFVLGRSSTTALAAYTVAMAVYVPVLTAVAGSLRGVIPFVAGSATATAELARIISNGRWLAVLGGSVGALVVLAVPLIGRLVGAQPSTVQPLGALPALLAVSLLISSVGTSGVSVLVGLGQGRAVLRLSLAATFVSVSSALLLIPDAGPLPGFGLIGAGLGMVATAVTSATLAQLAVRRQQALRSCPPGRARPDLREAARLARVGIPLAATVLVKFGVLGVLALAAVSAGTTSAAAHAIVISLVNLTFTAAVAVGQAVIPLVAVSARERDRRSMRRTVVTGGSLGTVTVLVLAALVVVFGDRVLNVATSDPEVVNQVIALLPLFLLAVTADAAQAVVGFALVGLRRTWPSFGAFAFCYGLLAAVAFPVVGFAGLTGLWIALALANLSLVAGQLVVFLRVTSERRSGGGAH